MISQDSYCEYLKTRSFVGLFYRRFWLYPKICRYLNGKVLDVGCGIGDMLAFRPNTIGVDVNPSTIEYCKARGLDARLMIPDILPFQSKMFNGAVLDNVLEHLDAPEPLLLEINRVLTSDGQLVVGVPGIRGYAADTDHKIFYDEKKLNIKLTDCGFNLITLFHMPIRANWLNYKISQYCIYGVYSTQG